MIQIKGKQEFMGMEIPVIEGGFGEGKKAMTDKSIAEIHNMKVIHIRENINKNIRRFKEGIDLINLKVIGDADNNLLASLGYTKMQISKANYIYLLSERGYSKLIKIMDTDLAWDIHDKLVDEYFAMREVARQLSKEDIAWLELKATNMVENTQLLLNTQATMFKQVLVNEINGENREFISRPRL